MHLELTFTSKAPPMITRLLSSLTLLLLTVSASADITTRTVNNGNLILQDIPEVPQTVVDDLNRYQNVRSAGLQDWSRDGNSIYISTRFGDVNQLHRVNHPGGARRQLTFYSEPLGDVQRQPKGDLLSYTMDTGGSEFTQIFVFDPKTAESRLLTDGESRNGVVTWSRDGTTIAYQSTRRNGQNNDVWVMPVDNPDAARMVLESTDGTWWGAIDFDQSGEHVLIANYISIADSRVHLLNVKTGEKQLLAGGEPASVNLTYGFDANDKGFWSVTDRYGEFKQLVWQALKPNAKPVVVTAEITWDIENLTISEDHQRGAFTVNENGRSKLYLLNAKTRAYRAVESIPTGLIFGLAFSPDGKQLGITLNTPKTPSDSFVLTLNDDALSHGALTRWTESEVGGLDTERFIEPELVEYPTFDKVDGKTRQIPAWVYRPNKLVTNSAENAGPSPVIISIHGGPEGQARPTFSSTYQMWLDKLGAAVIVPNVRGSSGYGKTYLSLDNGFKREDSVKDIGALLDWIATQSDLDQNRVALYGGSYGGYMVLAGAVHYSPRLKAAVDIVGISNFVTFLENTQDYRRDLRRVEYGDERDPDMRAHLQAISPLTNVSKISIPMLVAQGHNDPRVPYTEAEQVAAALRSQGHTVWYMDAMNEGHGYRRKENRDVYQQAMMLFWQQHLLSE